MEEDINSLEEKNASIIESRKKQSSADRLCEYITGLRIADPILPARIIEDQKVIRNKYNLPDRDLVFDSPSKYEDSLRKIAEENDVFIKEISACGSFSKEYPCVGGVSLIDNNAVGVNIDRSNESIYAESILILEHELIHSLQHKHQPAMPIEQAEYEAYIANINPEAVKNAGAEGLEIYFGFFIRGSVDIFYRSVSNERNEVVMPVWDNPEYFLTNVDGIVNPPGETSSLMPNKTVNKDSV